MGPKPDRKQKPSEHSGPPMATGDKVLTKEEEEEMSSALIAQLLAQEGGGDHLGYYAEYNNDANYGSLGDGDYSDDDDDYRNDYSYRPKSRSRRGGMFLGLLSPANPMYSLRWQLTSFFYVSMLSVCRSPWTEESEAGSSASSKTSPSCNQRHEAFRDNSGDGDKYRLHRCSCFYSNLRSKPGRNRQ